MAMTEPGRRLSRYLTQMLFRKAFAPIQGLFIATPHDRRMKSALKTPFVSAFLGGVLVAALCFSALAAGWVKSDSSLTVAAPLATPASDSGTGGAGGGTTVNRIYKTDGQGVAFIQAQSAPQPASPVDPFGSGGGGTATGSGFVIDAAGHILTNNHVVSGADKITVQLGDSERSYTAKLVGNDPATDLALLQVDAPADQLHPLALGSSSAIQVGDPVVAIGNPFGLDRTVTSGIVSALQRQIQAPSGRSISNVIQTDAAINPGNSGGPLINGSGQVVGINSQIETGGGGSGNVGIGFAIPINTARDVVNQIENGGTVKHAFLGISGGTIDSALASALNLPVQTGVLVQTVVPGGPAADAGLYGGDTQATIDGAGVRLGGDIITEIDGKRIGSMEDLVNIVNGSQPGDRLTLTVLRGGHTKSFDVKLGDGSK